MCVVCVCSTVYMHVWVYEYPSLVDEDNGIFLRTDPQPPHKHVLPIGHGELEREGTECEGVDM